MEDLQKLVASPMVTESEFPSTFLKALSTSGVETKYNIYSCTVSIVSIPRLKNCVFHLMRSKGLEKWILEQHRLAAIGQNVSWPLIGCHMYPAL